MTDHISVPPSERYEGSLEEIPQSYYHPICGVATGMPDEIIRSYLVNPFLYSDRTFCCGCNDYIPHDELFWVETEENLATYFARLKEGDLHKSQSRRV